MQLSLNRRKTNSTFTILISSLEGAVIRDFHEKVMVEATTDFHRQLAASVVDLINRHVANVGAYNVLEKPNIRITFTMQQRQSVVALLSIWINFLHDKSLSVEQLHALNASKRVVNLLNATSASQARS